MKITHQLIILSIVFLLSSCGGGNSSPSNEPELATPKNVKVERVNGNFVVSWTYPDTQAANTTFNLCYAEESINNVNNCTASSGGKLLKDVQNPTTIENLQAEDIFGAAKTYFFVVIAVSDGKSKASVNVEKLLENKPPIAIVENHYDVAYAELPLYKEGNRYTIDGSKSYDPDGIIVNYEWTQVGGPAVEWVEKNTATPTFIIPSREQASGHTEGETNPDPDSPYGSLSVIFYFTLEITDNNGSKSEYPAGVLPEGLATLFFRLENSVPEIQNISASSSTIKAGDEIVFSVNATDPDGDKLRGVFLFQSEFDFPVERIDEQTFSFSLPTVSSDKVTPFRVGADMTISFTARIEDVFGGSAKKAVDITLLASNDIEHTAPPPKLNDTGMTRCADNFYSYYDADNSELVNVGISSPLTSCGALIDEDGDLIPQGQDGHFGRDASHNEPADGNAGFSFTKLDEEGKDLPSTATTWSCVRDNVTGLIWEAKDTPNNILGESLHDGDDLFIWYEPDYSLNGGNDGGTVDFATNGDEIKCYGRNNNNIIWCSTHHFSQRVNQEKLCGFDDWRVPGIEELHSIADYSSEDTHSAYFSQFNEPSQLGYLSATPGITDDFWIFYFSTKKANLDDGDDFGPEFSVRYSPQHLMLVR